MFHPDGRFKFKLATTYHNQCSTWNIPNPCQLNFVLEINPTYSVEHINPTYSVELINPTYSVELINPTYSVGFPNKTKK